MGVKMTSQLDTVSMYYMQIGDLTILPKNGRIGFFF